MTIVNFQGVRELFYNYNEISEVWYNGELLWQKPKLASNAIRNATLQFGEYSIGGRFRYGVTVTSTRDDVVALFNQLKPKRLTYQSKTIPILASIVTGSRLILALDDPNKTNLYETITESVVYFE
ncbi:hypothetical protein [Streptococcus dysgalactiae]|uniref:hypothetical protein n=1 Tax=Streptococcus dysgalactiae TaxID=1334 RepID=UPI003F53E6FC